MPTRFGQRSHLAAVATGAGTYVFAVHPELGWPDEEWVADDPEFWCVRQR